MFEYISICTQRHMLLYNRLRPSLSVSMTKCGTMNVLLCVHSIVYVSFGFVISLFFLQFFFLLLFHIFFFCLDVYIVLDILFIKMAFT